MKYPFVIISISVSSGTDSEWQNLHSFVVTTEFSSPIDFNHSSYSSVYDESLSRVMNNKFFKICSWYDNEWGFSNRMLDVAKILARN